MSPVQEEVVIIKIDFENAFDTLDHYAILQVRKAEGYPERFLNWVKEVLTNSSYSILLNGVPGKSSTAKGESGKDILSPLLFVEVANLLKYLVNFSSQQGLYMPLFPSMVITQ
jgi:hypothetical protein